MAPSRAPIAGLVSFCCCVQLHARRALPSGNVQASGNGGGGAGGAGGARPAPVAGCDTMDGWRSLQPTTTTSTTTSK